MFGWQKTNLPKRALHGAGGPERTHLLIVAIFPTIALHSFTLNPLTMHIGKGNGQIMQKSAERTFKGAFPANQDIFVPIARLLWSNKTHRLSKTPLYAIANDRISQFFGRRKSKAGRKVDKLPFLRLTQTNLAGLQHKPVCREITPISGSQEISSFLKRMQSKGHQGQDSLVLLVLFGQE